MVSLTPEISEAVKILRGFLEYKSKRYVTKEVNGIITYSEKDNGIDVLGACLIGINGAPFEATRFFALAREAATAAGLNSTPLYEMQQYPLPYHGGFKAIEDVIKILDEIENHEKKKKKRPRRKGDRKPRGLTARQTEVLQLYGEFKGNLNRVAKQLGIHHSTAKEHLKTAYNKLGKKPPKHNTKQHATDQRGQANITNEDDWRKSLG